MNTPDPEKDTAKIVFIIFAFFMAMYILFAHHVANAYAQDNFDAGIITDSGTNDKSGTSKHSDPFAHIDIEDAIDTDPLTGLIDAGNTQKIVDYHYALDNPYYKKGYDFNWRAYNDYEYFVWLEADHRKTREELEQLEYEKIRIQEEITTAVMYNLVHCVRFIDNFGVQNPTCTKDNFGCRERVFALVGYIVDVAYDLDLDPWLMTAVAMHESTFNPFAKGPIGERGYFQINPRTPLGKKTKFVRSERYRQYCKHKLGNCQKEIAQAAGVHLYKDFKRCNNNIYRALTRYNTGGCLFHGHIRKKYVRSVLKNKARLQKKKPKVKWCDPSKKGKTEDYYL